MRNHFTPTGFAQQTKLSPNNDRSRKDMSKFSTEVVPTDMHAQAKYMVEHTKQSWTVMSRKGSSTVVVSDENLTDMMNRGYAVVRRYEYTPSRKELIESFKLYLDRCNEGGDQQ